MGGPADQASDGLMQPATTMSRQLLGLPKLQEPFIAKPESARTSPSRTQLGSRPSSSWVKATALLSERVLPGRSQNPATNGPEIIPRSGMQAPAEAFRSVRRTHPSFCRASSCSKWVESRSRVTSWVAGQPLQPPSPEPPEALGVHPGRVKPPKEAGVTPTGCPAA